MYIILIYIEISINIKDDQYIYIYYNNYIEFLLKESYFDSFNKQPWTHLQCLIVIPNVQLINNEFIK